MRYFARRTPLGPIRISDKRNPTGYIASCESEEEAGLIVLALNRLAHPGFLLAGKKQEHEDGWLRWALFDARKVTDEQAMDACSWYGYYNGPGAVFANNPYCRRTKSYLLVKQFGGLDV